LLNLADCKIRLSRFLEDILLTVSVLLDDRDFCTFSVYLCDSATGSEMDSEKTVESGRRTRLPLVDYTSVKYSDRLPAVLIFGSEATGLSHEAYELAARHNGLRVHIPLSGGVESLNLAAAAAVIAFEIRRQLVESDGSGQCA
jgi:tRNA(Leu) C34 or U34 (ribose-2'-O)-methylase TrmL